MPLLLPGLICFRRSWYILCIHACTHSCVAVFTKFHFPYQNSAKCFKVCKPLSNLKADSLYKACISFAHFKLKTSNTPKAYPTLCQCYLGGLHLLMLQSKSWHDQLSLCKPCQRRPHPPFPLDLGIAGSL